MGVSVCSILSRFIGGRLLNGCVCSFYCYSLYWWKTIKWACLFVLLLVVVLVDDY